jgi:sec-independent protein translocase protein TatB
MFDVGFSEIFVIALVALIVIGPERLPKVARTLGHLFGRMQRYVNDVKADITREMELDELRKLQSSVEDAARSIEHSVTREINTAESQLNSIAATAADAAPAPSSANIAPLQPETAALLQPLSPAAELAPVACAAPTPQLELGLDTPGEAARKQQ